MATGDKKRAVMTTDIDNSSSTYPVLSPSGDGSDVTAAFTAASTRTNISTGEKLGVIFGKIAKWFTDLGDAAFRGVDAAPTANSTNLVESGGVKSALNWISQGVYLRRISGESNSSIRIINGVDFSDYRNPILCVYATQSKGVSVFLVLNFSGALTVTTIYGGHTLSASISGNDIIVSGIGDWGNGFAVGY